MCWRKGFSFVVHWWLVIVHQHSACPIGGVKLRAQCKLLDEGFHKLEMQVDAANKTLDRRRYPRINIS